MSTATQTISIALLGQPNSGKSTLFNGLTGLHQHVGNWSGKTVEQKTGSFEWGGQHFEVCDLPGAYSLSAQSEEERITQAYIEGGQADVVCILADASQLSRSLYMLADYAGAQLPAVLVLNMMDVAELQGKHIDAALLEHNIGIPVVPFVANDPAGYNTLIEAIERATREHRVLDSSKLEQLYQAISPEWESCHTKYTSDTSDAYFNSVWLAARDAQTTEAGAQSCAQARYAWVDQVLSGVQSQPSKPSAFMQRLDEAMLSPRWGKLVCIGVILVALLACMICGSPIMMVGFYGIQALSAPLFGWLSSLGVSDFIAGFVANELITVVSFATAMSGFVFGVTFVFNALEEIGVISRISYVFDDTMRKLGLQGKAMMPFLVSCGCTMGGVTGARVVDSWGQRVLTIAMTWAVPCGATFTVIPTLAMSFFGIGGAMLVMCGVFLIMVGVMFLVARLFGRELNPVAERTGLVMELPPYHKPRLRALLVGALRKCWQTWLRALRIIFIVATVFYLLSWSPTGNAEGSVLYAFGHAIEPVTMIFGLSWRTFLAFLGSMFAKEAVFGVLSALYGGGGGLFHAMAGAKSASFTVGSLVSQIPTAEALAFMFAVAFNVPCLMTISTTINETHSWKWTLKIIGFYFVLALCISFIVYHVALLFVG